VPRESVRMRHDAELVVTLIRSDWRQMQYAKSLAAVAACVRGKVNMISQVFPRFLLRNTRGRGAKSQPRAETEIDSGGSSKIYPSGSRSQSHRSIEPKSAAGPGEYVSTYASYSQKPVPTPESSCCARRRRPTHSRGRTYTPGPAHRPRLT
jgi:hypothetical protein